MRLPDPDGSYAVLIGAAKYGADSGFISFPSIKRSMDEFAEFLRSTTGLQNVTTVLDPPDGASFSTALTAANATDLLLFYYVGHGVPVDNELHLTHTGSHADHADFTTVPYTAIRAKIKASRAQVKIVILDCCHSGKAFGRGVLADGANVLVEAADIEGTFVLTATDEKKRFAAASDDAGRTAFTGALLDVLRSGIPSADRYLTMSAIFHELRARLPAANLPNPKALERGTAADLALTHNAAWSGDIATPVLPGTESTAYFAQIRDIAPSDEMIDRADEVRELAAFCDGDERYLWWRGEPWTGKTTFMSWFALNPPEHVRVVAFFITSRMAAQSDHVAFTDAVLEQLSALLPGERAAVTAAVGNRDALRRHLLDLAAQRAIECGNRVLLMVDGLDEDHGQPTIASLLPKNPPPGLRVVVASRPNPPIPDDVSDGHPLRTCRHRTLESYSLAGDHRRAAKLELARLLHESDDTRRVLGLLTAAGGLTGPELVDLTQLPPYWIEDLLRGVTGRTFRTRTSRFVPDHINLLAHETLQREAEKALGRKLLDEYRDQIHQWARRYRAQGWPETTPTYLLTRYFAMLKDQADLTRMADIALDAARHDRMLHLTGGDIAARTEIGTTQDLILGQADSDLLTMCRLSMQRLRLARRSANIPDQLPRAFALLGAHDRAESLARSIPDPQRQASALIGVIAVSAGTPRIERIQVIVESLIHQIAAAPERDRLLAELAGALIAAGAGDAAELVLSDIREPINQVRALTELVPARLAVGRIDDAGRAMEEAAALIPHIVSIEEHDSATALIALALAAMGETGRAADCVRGIRSADRRARAWADLAPALHLAPALRTSDVAAARQVVVEAVRTLESVDGGQQRAAVAAAITTPLVAAGFIQDARRLAEIVEPAISDDAPDWLVSGFVEYFVAVGEFDRTEAIADQLVSPTSRAETLTLLIPALVRQDRRDEARRLADQVEALARRTDAPRYLDTAFANLVAALITATDLTTAQLVAERISSPDRQAGALARVAVAIAAAGHTAAARRLADRAEALLDAITDAHDHAMSLADLVSCFARIGATEHALGLADRVRLRANEINILWPRLRVLSRLAAVLLDIGEIDRAIAVPRGAGGLFEQVQILGDLMRSVRDGDAARRLVAEAEALSWHADYSEKMMMRSGLVIAMARVGDFDRAVALAEQISLSAHHREQASSKLVAVLAESGDIARAERLARNCAPRVRVTALTTVVNAYAAAGDRAAARALLTFTEGIAQRITSQRLRNGSTAALVVAAIRIGDTEHAEALARAADGPDVRAEALTHLAREIATSSDTLDGPLAARLRQLLAEIWSLGSWYESLDILARIDPDLLVAIATEAMALDPR
ncbi:caspase, EACC1-associated type [Nocardia sp. CA-107356]|uniref:caspase, EACC1-associated type n=1 Tax=Nocardia sp. CA-107356 TaxID=3239972 RepID=UPI003D8E5460